MQKTKTILSGIAICFIAISLSFKAHAQIKTYKVKSFEKVTVSPHIEVTFVEGNQESVVIHSADIDLAKLNLEQSGNELHLYLDGAKTTTKNKKVVVEGYKGKHPIYKGTIITATVYYKSINALSLRGEETFKVESELKNDKFQLSIYGESDVELKAVNIDQLNTAIYGESEFKIASGTIGRHKITCFGESEVNSLNVKTKEMKITSYGESEFNVNVDQNLKITSYGEADIKYKGDAVVDKGIVLGESSIRNIN